MNETLGRSRTRAGFNPSGNHLVETYKNDAGYSIDRLEEMKNDSSNPEQKRLFSLAQTAYEEACMWAVKAMTFND